MRLARFRRGKTTGVGMVEGDSLVILESSEPVSRHSGTSMRALVEEGLGTYRPVGPLITLADVTLLAPIDDPRKIVAIGLNYADHAAEGSVAVPAEPLVFAKFPTSIVGPGQAIGWPARLTEAVDYEAELAVVIGRGGRNIPIERALDFVFGYTCLNDVSARDLQFADGQWVRAKSIDTFCPIGPWIVTADEIPDPQSLAIGCLVSGERLQDANTADMHFSVAALISLLSRSFAFEPGDVIATGTPPGVGWFREPRRLLHAGDTVTVSIQGIGDLVNPVAGPRRKI